MKVMMMDTKQGQNGSALIYILIAIALLALLTSSLMEPSNQQAQSQNQSNLITEMQSQISFISSAVQECVINYPNQDSALTTTQQKNAPYPINPNDPYFASSTPATAANGNVENIRCPGNPGGAGATSKNHAKIFGGSSGKFLPPPPNLMDAWVYYNGADGVFIYTSTTKTDAYITAALTKLDAKYSPCEADVIDASSAAVNMSTDTTPGASGVRQCASGARCFRFWIIRKPTAVPAVTACNS